MKPVKSDKIDAILSKHQHPSREHLIPILQSVQNEFGYIPKDAVKKIGTMLSISASKIYGVATFYNQFKFNPPGKYHIMVCRGTACHVKGSLSVLNLLEEILKIKAGQTTKDGLFSIETVACMGACSLAPVISINGEYYGEITRDKLEQLVKSIRGKEQKNDKP